MDIFNLVASITLDSSEYEEGLSEASNTTKNFGSKMGSALKTAGKIGAASIAAVGAAGALMAKKIWSGTQELAEYGDHIDKMSQKMGISAQAYQEWDAVLQHSGTSIDSMRRGMTTLSQQAQKGADAFDKLGISQEQLASMSQEELFSATIEGLQKMEAGTERTALAQQLLGGSAKELGALLNTSAEDTQKMKDRVHELGGVMSDEAVKAAAKFQDNMQDLGTAISGVKRNIQADFLPAANDILEGFTKLIAGEEGAEEQISQGMDALAENVSNAIDEIIKIGEKLMPQISELLGKLMPKIIELGGKIMLSLAEGFVNNLPVLLESLTTMASMVAQDLPSIVKTVLPALLEALIQVAAELAQNIPQIFSAVVEALGEALLGAGDVIKEKLPALAAVFEALEPVIMGVVAALAAYKAAMAIATVISTVKNIMAALTAVTEGQTLAQTILNAVMMANPFVLIATAIGALVAVFVVLWKKCEGFRDFWKNAWEGIKKVTKAVVDVIVNIFKTAWEVIKGVWSVLVSFFSGLWEGVKAVFSAVVEFFSNIFGGAADAATGAFGGIIDFFSGIWDGIAGIFGGVADWFGGVFSGAADLITGAFGGIVSFFSGIWDGITGVFSGVADWFSSTFGAAANAVKAAFKDVNNTVQQTSIVAGQGLNAASAYAGSSSGMPSYIPKKHAKGGVFYHSTLGIFGEAGAEAVVPLDQNTKWVHAVATDFAEQLSGMTLASGGSSDIIIPVYIGQERIDEIVVSAQQRANYRSGGRG